jgi:hypothetical protein
MNYFVLGSGNSPLFTDKRYQGRLEDYGLVRVKSPLFAKLIICRNIDIAKKAVLLFPLKKILVYQIELFVDTTKTKLVHLYKFKPVVVINGFNKGVFFNNYHFLSSYIYDDECDLGLKKGELISAKDLKTKKQFDEAKPIIFIGKKRSPEEINKNNSTIGVDLNAKRQAIARCAYDRNVGDVVGSGWNQLSGIKNSGFDSGNEAWWNTKLELLKGYRFNIAFENTLWKYYVTEKIWHSIKVGCLPVYWGKGSSIYESFPKNSFIDASEFKSINELIDYMTDLSYTMWLERMKKCIEVYNTSLKKMTYSKLDEAIEKVKERLL